jgi:hypothetical protein
MVMAMFTLAVPKVFVPSPVTVRRTVLEPVVPYDLVTDLPDFVSSPKSQAKPDACVAPAVKVIVQPASAVKALVPVCVAPAIA